MKEALLLGASASSHQPSLAEDLAAWRQGYELGSLPCGMLNVKVTRMMSSLVSQS